MISALPRLCAAMPDTNHLGRLYALAFLESLGTILLERGLYFYTHDVLGFTEIGNLALALLFGAAYVGGAFASHRVCTRFGEKRAAVATLVGLFTLHTALALHRSEAFIVATFGVVAALQGLKWPIIESYASAGQTPARVLKILGRFNVSWAGAVAPALIVTGLLVGSPHPELLFALAAGLNVVALWLAAPWPPGPRHLPDDHPERPPRAQVVHFNALLGASRWMMLASYALLFLLAPLMPEILSGLGLRVSAASASSSVLDLIRLFTFAVLGAYPAWHGRTAPVMLAMVVLPLGFGLVLFGASLPLVFAGQILFGAAAGFIYNAALYYALVVNNASVHAGGVHEGLIGFGFVLGPLLGLLGHGLAASIGSYTAGMLCGVAPLYVVCSAGAMRALVHREGLGAA